MSEQLWEAPSKVSERGMLTHLHRRYTAVRRGTIKDRWVRAEHVRRYLGHALRQRIADFIALDTYPGNNDGRDLAVHGHEVKVSRSDWLTELRDPDKAEAFRPYCHHWWLVVPDASIVRPDELPEGWGLMALTKVGLRVKIKSPRQEPEPMPLELAMALAAATARTANRAPLYLDAAHGDKVREDKSATWGYQHWDVCAACGELAPCPYHQPREFGLAASKDDSDE